jgi:hypothetical protein
MGALKIQVIKRIKSEMDNSSPKCPRCYGCLVDDCEAEFEFFSQRCVLCGYRHELKTKNNLIDNSQSINEVEWEF